MQPGGQYGVPPDKVQSQYGVQARGPATSGSSASHTVHQLFNLDVSGSGLALSTSASSISHHHAAHSPHYSLGQTHHQNPPQSAGILTQPYFMFQDHLQAQPLHHHHHQSLQSPHSTSASQQHQQLDPPAPPLSTAALGHLHHAQFQPQPAQKQESMVAPINIRQHAGQDHGPLLQQYAHHQQQQQQQHLNLALESPVKPMTSSSMQQQLTRPQQLAPAASGPAISTAATTLNSAFSMGFNSSTAETSAAATTVLAAAPTTTSAAIITSVSVLNNASSTTIDLQQEAGNKLQAGNNPVQADQQGGNIDDVDVLGDEGEKGSGGNRWPRQETLALLRVRSEMDAAFRDSSLKRPLWDEVSRKLGELGFQRSAKKCKEKFENVHKYYKRTKEGKAGRQDGKNYRFFSELEALYGGQTSNSNVNISAAAAAAGNCSTSLNAASAGIFSLHARSSGLGSDDYLGPPPHLLASASSLPAKSSFSLVNSLDVSVPAVRTPTRPGQPAADTSGPLHFSSDTSSGSGDDDDDDEEAYEDPSDNTAPDHSKKRKRKSMQGRMMAFFENLLKQVMDKQEQMQHRFLEALERREQDRMIREEAWKRQEMARLSREHDLRAQERSLAAARDAAIVTFIQKVTGQTFQLPTSTALAMVVQPVQSQAPIMSSPFDTPTYQNVSEDQDPFDPTSKRWPKPEVLSLIKLRTNLHARFCEPGPKSTLWEDIAHGMSRLGYNRNSKRCKEKWENINKYFKKAKESNKNRPENAKTCPYYHQLDALYKQGVLGSGGVSLAAMSNVKALPYKSQGMAMDATDSQHIHQRTVGADDQVLAPEPASQRSTASDATASTGNAINMPSAGGSMMSKDMNMQPTNVDHNMSVMDGDIKQDTKEAHEGASRVALISENTMVPINGPGTSSSSLMQNMQQQNLNQGYIINERKVDLEQEARVVDDADHIGRYQEQVNILSNQAQMQQIKQGINIRPPGSIPAPTSAFMTTSVLPNFNSSRVDVPAGSNTSTTSTNQEH